MSHFDSRTDGQKIVDAIVSGSEEQLRQAVTGLNPKDLQQIYVEINQANAARQADNQLPVTVIVNDQDNDGHVDATGTNHETGKTIGAEGA